MSLLPKPIDCIGCPEYGDGLGFVPDALVEGAEDAFLAQGPGASEEAGQRLLSYQGRDRITEPVTPQPLIGPTGYALTKDYLPRSGLTYATMSRLNVLKCRPTGAGGKKTDVLPKGDRLKIAIAHCTRAYLRVPPSTRRIIAHGATALDFSQCQHLSIDAWRGYVAPQPCMLRTTDGGKVTVPVYVTQHTARLFRSPAMKAAARADFARLGRWRKGEWPQPWPTFLVAPAESSFESACDVVANAVTAQFLLSLDTEYAFSEEHIPGQHPLTVVGMAWRHPERGLEGAQFILEHLTDEQRVALQNLLQVVAQQARVVFQNMAADLPVLEFQWPELKRELWMRPEDLMLLHAMLWVEQKHSLEYIASVRGILPKYTHLLASDPVKKNQGDCVETLVCFEQFEREGKMDPLVYSLYRERLKLVPLHTRASERGIAIDKEGVLPALRSEIQKMEYGLRLARAYVGFPLNMGSPGEEGQLATVLYKHLGLPLQRDLKTKKATVDMDAVGKLRQKVGPKYDAEEEEREGLTPDMAESRCEHGANPVLEGRVLYSKALQNISHYLAPLVKVA